MYSRIERICPMKVHRGRLDYFLADKSRNQGSFVDVVALEQWIRTGQEGRHSVQRKGDNCMGRVRQMASRPI